MRSLERVADSELLRVFLPSFVATASWDSDLEYELSIGIDDDDPFYAERENQTILLQDVRRALHGRRATVSFHPLRGMAHAPCWLWNELFARAYDDGADYFYQMGDDVRLMTPGWARSFIDALESNAAGPGLGVAGPHETVTTRILTQAFVSRLHKDVFGTFYPPVFKNWFSDDWITEVYRPEHLFVCASHVVDNVGGLERYDIDRAAEGVLAEEVSKGKERLAAWLSAPGLPAPPR
jgi:hypothetical protein